MMASILEDKKYESQANRLSLDAVSGQLVVQLLSLQSKSYLVNSPALLGILPLPWCPAEHSQVSRDPSGRGAWELPSLIFLCVLDLPLERLGV